MRVALGTTIIEVSEHQPISIILEDNTDGKEMRDWVIDDISAFFEEHEYDDLTIMNIGSCVICTKFPKEWTIKERDEMLDVLEAKVHASQRPSNSPST